MTDELAAFVDALPDRARRIRPQGQHIDALIYAALSREWTPASLAEYVAGTDHGLALTTGRMHWRLRRAAGLDDEGDDA